MLCFQFVELKTLWQLTSAEQSVVARGSCQAWVELVLERDVGFTYVMNGFLNQVPSAKLVFSISSVAAVIEPQREKTCLQRFASGQSDQRLCYSLFGKYHI